MESKQDKIVDIEKIRLETVKKNLEEEKNSEKKKNIRKAKKNVKTERNKKVKAKKKAAKKMKKNKKKKLHRKSATESRITDICASVIDFHDKIQNRVDRVFITAGKSIVKEFDNGRTRYKHSLKQMMKSFFMIAVICCLLMVVFEYNTAFQYAYNGRVLGYVDSQSEVADVLGVTGEHISENNDADIEFKIGENISFKKVAKDGKDIDTPDQVVNKLTYMKDIEVTASGIYEDGKLKSILEDKNTAQKVLDNLKEEYSKTDDGMKLVKCGFKNKVEIKPVNVMISSVQTQKEAKETLMDGGQLTIYHIVNEDENLATITKTYDTKKEQIIEEDSGVQAGDIKAGEKIRMNKTVDPITVKMVEDGTMVEVIEYNTVEKETDELYKGDKEVKQKGEDGRQSLTGKVTKENGEIVKRDLKNKEIIKKPVDEIILVGTSDKPKTAPTGTFIYPTRGCQITSYFGMRWGRMHKGLDFAKGMGVPIYASDGGVVTMAGSYGAYGNCIQIDHGSGKSTLYGHCSTLLVSKGQAVYQGQEIAKMGSTGRSTGPHVHFEIRINGTQVNPLPYLK